MDTTWLDFDISGLMLPIICSEGTVRGLSEFGKFMRTVSFVGPRKAQRSDTREEKSCNILTALDLVTKREDTLFTAGCCSTQPQIIHTLTWSLAFLSASSSFCILSALSSALSAWSCNDLIFRFTASSDVTPAIFFYYFYYHYPTKGPLQRNYSGGSSTVFWEIIKTQDDVGVCWRLQEASDRERARPRNALIAFHPGSSNNKTDRRQVQSAMAHWNCTSRTNKYVWTKYYAEFISAGSVFFS